MKGLFIFLCVFSLVLDYVEPQSCDPIKCVLPNCRCMERDIPGNLKPNETPQFVILTFDGALQQTTYNLIIEAISNRANPNKCPISATFFINHEYTNYSMVHEMHAAGHEIGLNSISYNPLKDYWKFASVETLTKEFADQRLIMTKFGAIPAADMKGIRMPMFQMAGNNQMDMLNKSKFLYDFSRSSNYYSDPGAWPYTYDYPPSGDCSSDNCPTQSFPNIWSIPMTEWQNDVKNQTCATIDGCGNYNTGPNSTFDWMKREFLKQYEKNRSPVGLFLQPVWFSINPKGFAEYKLFLDYLATLDDVYIISASRVIDWVRNPITITEMLDKPCQRIYRPNCRVKECRLLNADWVERYMTMCGTDCPLNYPWLGNPLGN